MNKVTRLLTMTGMGLVAAVTMAGPAQAAASADVSAASKPAVQKHWDRGDREVTVGYYWSLRKCHMDGRIGERWGKYRDYDCEYVRRGPNRGKFALEVEFNRRWGGGFGGHGGHGGFGGGIHR